MLVDPMEACCTCATLLSSLSTDTSEKSRKCGQGHRRLKCCHRIICGNCIDNNPRFAEYCPYCQISSIPSVLPQRLKNPPLYTSVPGTTSRTAELSDTPPPYSETPPVDSHQSGGGDPEKNCLQDTLHFLNHEHDTITSLSFRYGVPAAALRRANNIASDHLLQGRRTILIPAEFYKGGVSLSPRPVEGEEEERRKSKIRRFMTVTKVSNYDIAVLYLEQSGYDLEAAAETFLDDEKWEKEHPQGKGNSPKKQPPGKAGFFWRR